MTSSFICCSLLYGDNKKDVHAASKYLNKMSICPEWKTKPPLTALRLKLPWLNSRIIYYHFICIEKQFYGILPLQIISHHAIWVWVLSRSCPYKMNNTRPLFLPALYFLRHNLHFLLFQLKTNIGPSILKIGKTQC